MNLQSWGGVKFPFYIGNTKCQILTDAQWTTFRKVPDFDPLRPREPVEFDLRFLPSDPFLKGVEFNFQGVGLVPLQTGGMRIHTTSMVRCTVGGGLTGKAKVFCFYGYQDPLLSQGARYHRPVGLVMELR